MYVALDYKLLQFRLATPQDYRFIHSFSQNSTYAYVKSDSFLPESWAEEKSTAYMVYSPKGDFVGFIKGFYNSLHGALWIQLLLIHHSFFRKGYGTYITLSFVQKINAFFPLSKIYLTCHPHNSIAISFWESLGFSKTKTNIKSSFDLYETDLRSLKCKTNFIKH